MAVKAWEYYAQHVTRMAVLTEGEKLLDAAGADGWELVSAVWDEDEYVFFFKRELPR